MPTIVLSCNGHIATKNQYKYALFMGTVFSISFLSFCKYILLPNRFPSPI